MPIFLGGLGPPRSGGVPGRETGLLRGLVGPGGWAWGAPRPRRSAVRGPAGSRGRGVGPGVLGGGGGGCGVRRPPVPVGLGHLAAAPRQTQAGAYAAQNGWVLWEPRLQPEPSPSEGEPPFGCARPGGWRSGQGRAPSVRWLRAGVTARGRPAATLGLEGAFGLRGLLPGAGAAFWVSLLTSAEN